MNGSRHLNCVPEARILEEEQLQSLIGPAQLGDQDAREAIVRSNVRLVLSIIHRFYHRGYELEDLFQIGCIGLVKAIDRYDPQYGVRFSTYAVPLIIGEVRRFLRDDGPIHVGRSLKEMASTVHRVKEKLLEATGREPSIGEIAEDLGITPDLVVECTEAIQAPTSLQALCGGEEYGPRLGGEQLGTDIDEMEECINRIALSDVLDRLPYRLREIMVGRYYRDETQAIIAERLGISQVQVSRLERQTLMVLRSAFNENTS